MEKKISNRRWSEAEFFDKREEVFSKAPQDRKVDLDEAVKYCKSMPKEKIASEQLSKAKKDGKTLLSHFGGYPTMDATMRFHKLLEQAGASILTLEIDTYTRHEKYEEAKSALESGLAGNRLLLNGFPSVTHGLDNYRRVTESTGIPVRDNATLNMPIANLPMEIAAAGGATILTGSPLACFLQFATRGTFESAIIRGQYNDRLLGYYAENGVIKTRQTGVLCSVLSPPGIVIAQGIIDSMLAAEQGVRSISLEYGLSYCLAQDIVTRRLSQELTDEYLRRFGYSDVDVTTMPCQYLGAWPEAESRGYAALCFGAAIAVLSRATGLLIKQPREAFGAPSIEKWVEAAEATRYVFDLLQNQNFPDSGVDLDIEMEMTDKEVRSIVDEIIKFGGGDVIIGAKRAIEAGVLDTPFSANRSLANRVVPIRDKNGAVRYLDHGNLPLPEDVKKFHEKKVAERRTEERHSDTELAFSDVLSIASGHIP